MGGETYHLMRKLASFAINGFYRKDGACFDELYQATYRLLCHVSFGILGNEEDAKDVVNETYLRALEKEPIKKKAIKSYLCQIARNLSLDRLRLREYMEADPESALQEAGEKDEEPNSLLDKVKQILNPEEYDCLFFRIYHELSFQEIAQILSLPSPSSARGIYHRAKRKCQEELKEEFR